MTDQTEREAFEHWALEKSYSIDPEQTNAGVIHYSRYGSKAVQLMWEAWQARASLQGGEKCIWRETEEMWEADCGAAWTFNDGGPKENSMKYCHVCGKEIDVDACHARKEG